MVVGLFLWCGTRSPGPDRGKGSEEAQAGRKTVRGGAVSPVRVAAFPGRAREAVIRIISLPVTSTTRTGEGEGDGGWGFAPEAAAPVAFQSLVFNCAVTPAVKVSRFTSQNSTSSPSTSFSLQKSCLPPLCLAAVSGAE